MMASDASEPRPQWQSWIDAWNRHDLDAIMTHYADDVLFASRVVVELGGDLDGTIRGKTALRELFARGLHADPSLHFSPIHSFHGVADHALHYIGFRRRHVIEIHRLNAVQQIIEARAYHGDVAPRAL
jgi:hypothetical protein